MTTVDDLARLIVDARESVDPPFVFAIAGGVGVGKTTLAEHLAQVLGERGVSVTVVATDHFLLPNAVLDERGLSMRKGFPETYETALITDVVQRLKHGETATAPVYDHQAYDRLAEVQQIAPTDVLILEGVNVLQADLAPLADLALYLDVDEAHAEQWFHQRFQTLCDVGEGFYASLSELSADERRSIAAIAWTSINLVNLREHIAPTKALAHIVVRKDADHRFVSDLSG